MMINVKKDRALLTLYLARLAVGASKQVSISTSGTMLAGSRSLHGILANLALLARACAFSSTIGASL